MDQYRCFFLDREQYVLKVEIAECADDGSARRWAEGLARPDSQIATLELWRQSRMIARYPAGADAASARA